MNQQVYPISFWVAPSNTRERWQEVADCGFTVPLFNAPTPEEGRQVLDWLQELGIQGIVIDPRIDRDLPDRADWEQVVQAVVDDYSSHPALYGYYITDEPSLSHFQNLAKINRAFLQRDPERVPFINLFPNYASATQLGTVSYDEHLTQYMDTVQPRLLSYDHYAQWEDHDIPEYFPNLESIRAQALRTNTPFMNIVMTTPLFRYRDPSPEDLRYSLYTTLAYGGKGLAWFTYVTPDAENFRSGPLTIHERKTPKWYMVRDLNLELQRLGPWLMGLTSTGVYHVGEAVPGTQTLAGGGVVLSAEGGELLVGEYKDEEGLPWVMVVNKDRARSCFVTLRLKTFYKTLSEVARSDGALRAIARDQGVQAGQVFADGMEVRFWLAPADGRLMRLSE